MTQAAAKSCRIPEISEEKLTELCKRIKPIVRMARVKTRTRRESDSIIFTTRVHPRGKWTLWEGGNPFFIKPVDPRNIAFMWSPKPSGRATKLQTLCDITTYHTWGYYGMFKPSIAEVIAQIPEEHLGKVVAFEIVDYPRDADDLNRQMEIVNEGYHLATTRLYSQAVKR